MKRPAPQLLKGFRDFLPKEKRRRDLVMRKITATFEKFGFEPIETPTLEYRETIMGKYGDEADKLVYSFKDKGERAVALRYDQTVPTARVIANYQNDLPLPFRRYQTQNVFRADKPQKGRYREFTQCDIDIFGSQDALADAEILACTYSAYKAVGFKTVKLRVNDRKILIDTLTPFATDKVGVFSIISTLDKADKITRDQIVQELVGKGLTIDAAQKCSVVMDSAKVSDQLQEIIKLSLALGIPKEALEFSPMTARGLDYYTGMIFEVRIPGYEVGSVGGGGRYDNLIEDLCGVQMSAVGMAFGFDRTVEAALEMGVLSQEAQTSKILMTIFDGDLVLESAKLANTLRNQGQSIELYPRVAELAKQLKYADKSGIRYCLILGSNEVKNEEISIKDLQTGSVQKIKQDMLSARLFS